MAHATVGYCFTGNPEDGGEGLLIGLHRCQAFKVAQRKHMGSDGINYNKGDVISTDCNVTGTDVGTPAKPKFALKCLWEHVLIPALETLVAPGGKCEGAVVVHQEDNAGPHKEGKYHEWLQDEFQKRGWHLELQVASPTGTLRNAIITLTITFIITVTITPNPKHQGPYTNVLDLQLFPAMSKRHSELLHYTTIQRLAS